MSSKPLTALPPPFPAGGSALATARWSLQLRLWAWRHERAPGPAPDVRLFLLFHDPARTPTLPSSVARWVLMFQAAKSGRRTRSSRSRPP